MKLKHLHSMGVRIYGDVTYRGACPPEVSEQITFFNQLRKRFPLIASIALHPRNEALLKGGQFSAIRRHRAEGMSPGAADIIIPGCPAFVCELKRQDHTKSAWQEGQQNYLASAASLGAFACVALGADAALTAANEWAKKINTENV